MPRRDGTKTFAGRTRRQRKRVMNARPSKKPLEQRRRSQTK